jgi:hypothetical protein
MSSCKETSQLSNQAQTLPKEYSCSCIAVLWSDGYYFSVFSWKTDYSEWFFLSSRVPPCKCWISISN